MPQNQIRGNTHQSARWASGTKAVLQGLNRSERFGLLLNHTEFPLGSKTDRKMLNTETPQNRQETETHLIAMLYGTRAQPNTFY